MMGILSGTRRAVYSTFALVTCLSMTGCIAVGYSSGGGWFFWPGGIGLLLLILLALFLVRRR